MEKETRINYEFIDLMLKKRGYDREDVSCLHSAVALIDDLKDYSRNKERYNRNKLRAAFAFIQGTAVTLQIPFFYNLSVNDINSLTDDEVVEIAEKIIKEYKLW